MVYFLVLAYLKILNHAHWFGLIDKSGKQISQKYDRHASLQHMTIDKP